MTVYSGDRTMDGVVVLRDGAPLALRDDIARISDVGFDWGFDGPAPRQLALALLADHLGDAERALRTAPAFARVVTARLANDWELDSDYMASTILALEDVAR